MTTQETDTLANRLSEKIGIPEGQIAAALKAMAREDVIKIARNEPEKNLGKVLPLRQEEEIDLTLYEGKQAC